MFANSKKVTIFAPAIEREILDKKDGPFVYRLGRKIFILERGVRFPLVARGGIEPPFQE